ncbi:transposase [Streptomyces sp. MUSC 14]|uniref:transposase n=1 Tax=Streptomyces sp. MUSC 14 TaxID=1354889 RepID=UPI003528AAD2
MTEHLGYEKHDPAGRGSGNSRSGNSAKTVLTDVGAVTAVVPRDRNGDFEPQMVPKNAPRPCSAVSSGRVRLSWSCPGCSSGWSPRRCQPTAVAPR